MDSSTGPVFIGLWKNRLRLISDSPIGLGVVQGSFVLGSVSTEWSEVCRMLRNKGGGVVYTHVGSIDYFPASIMGIGEFNYIDTRHYRPWQVK